MADTIARAREERVPVKLGVLHHNHAINLYRRMGFVDCGRTETHTLMEWKDDKPLPSMPAGKDAGRRD